MGDSIQFKDNVEGTLGGFVTKTNNNQKIYALTCIHLFPSENEYSFTRDFEDIGACVFTTRNNGCAEEKMNANVYSNSLQNGNIVHEKGATRDVTNGIILSSKFLFKSNRQKQSGNIFLVRGTAEKVFEKGDSGSLIFSRPNHLQQNYVDMVYSNDLILYNDDEDDYAEDQNEMKSKSPEGSRQKGW